MQNGGLKDIGKHISTPVLQKAKHEDDGQHRLQLVVNGICYEEKL